MKADEANAKGLACKNGHVGVWGDQSNGPNKYKTRRCNQCSKDRARTNIYGITPEAFAQLKADFPVCAICGGDGADHGLRILEIDHDHDTGQIRGLLCRKCNIFLGHYESRKHTIPALERYLNAKR